MAGVKINKHPKFLAEDTYEKTHPIIIGDALSPNQPLIIKLVLKVVKRYFPYRKPRENEYEDESIPHIVTTSKAPVREHFEDIFLARIHDD